MRFRFLGALVLIGSLWGCGGSEYGEPLEVTGKVTEGGEPAAGVNVEFHATESELPAEHRTRMTTTDDQGVYELDDVYPATYEVRIQKFETGEVDPGAAPAVTGGAGAAGPDGENKPPRTAQVSAEATSFDFDLDEDE